MPWYCLQPDGDILIFFKYVRLLVKYRLIILQFLIEMNQNCFSLTSIHYCVCLQYLLHFVATYSK